MHPERYKIKSFFDRIITGDDKQIQYDNPKWPTRNIDGKAEYTRL